MIKNFSINRRVISTDSRPYIIAELSANHNGSINRALNTIKAAKDVGVHAVKIQTYTPDTMTINHSSNDFKIKKGLWKGRTLYDLYAEAYTPFEWHKRLFNYAKKIGMTIFSSPFDESAVDLLKSLNAPAYKVASFEMIDLPLIAYIAKTKKPILISTGMANLEEIKEAIETAKSNGSKKVAILHCISSYPAQIEESNIRAILNLRKKFQVHVGLSDHTKGNLVSVVATSLGASIIEKHFTLSRSEGGVDSSFSLNPTEMKQLINDTASAHAALGSNNKMRSNTELQNKLFRRSLYFITNIKKGEVITDQHIKRIRPGFGLSPKYYYDIIGSKCLKSAKRGDRVTIKHFVS